jgi:hypothetical protein
MCIEGVEGMEKQGTKNISTSDTIETTQNI